MKCTVSGCNNEAHAKLTYNHPKPEARWSGLFCREHAHEAAAMDSHGRLTFSEPSNENTSH